MWIIQKTIEQHNGKRLMEQVANEMDNLQLGEIRRFTVAGNNCQVKAHLQLYMGL